MRRSPVVMWIGLAVGVVVVGWIAGFVFGQSAPDIAARQVVREFVRLEPVTLDVQPTDAVAPTSGGNEGQVHCGRVEGLGVDDEVATLDAGRAIVHVRAPEDVARIEAALADEPAAAWAVVVDDRVEAAVVTTAWGVVMPLDDVDDQLLTAFVIGYTGQRGPLPACS